MSTRIIVKNGDWDKARAELGTVLEASKNRFNAQFDAAFGPRTPAPVAATPAAPSAPVKSTGPLVLSRSSRR